MSDTTEVRIIELLTGGLHDEREVATLLQELAATPEGIRALTDHLALTRGMGQMIESITPDLNADANILQEIRAIEKGIPVRSSGRWGMQAIAGVLLLMLGLLVGDLFDINLVKIQSDKEIVGSEGQKKIGSPLLLDSSSTAFKRNHLERLLEEKSSQVASVQASHDSLLRAYHKIQAENAPGSHPYQPEASEIRILHFDGIDDYVTIPDSEGEINPGESFTIEAYVHPEKLDGKRWIATYATSDSGSNFLFGFDDGRLRLTIYDRDRVSNDLLSFTKLKPGIWYHVAGVHDKETSTLRIYINGRLEGELKGGAVSNSITQGMTRLGSRGTGTESSASERGFFAGLMQNIHIWKKNLSEDNIIGMLYGEALYQNRASLLSGAKKEIEIPALQKNWTMLSRSEQRLNLDDVEEEKYRLSGDAQWKNSSDFLRIFPQL